MKSKNCWRIGVCFAFSLLLLQVTKISLKFQQARIASSSIKNDYLSTSRAVQKIASSHTASWPNLPNKRTSCCQMQGFFAFWFVVIDLITALICFIEFSPAISTMHDITQMANSSVSGLVEFVRSKIAERHKFLCSSLLEIVEKIMWRKSSPVSRNLLGTWMLGTPISETSPNSSSESEQIIIFSFYSL